MKNSKAIVTLAIGDKYESFFDKICKRSWQEYCDRYSYDLVVIKSHLDTSDRALKRSPAWQKLLILSQDWSSEYEQIVWLDTDIIINTKTAADIAGLVPSNKIGAVEAYSIPSRFIHDISLKRQYDHWKKLSINYLDNLSPQSYYLNRNIQGNHLDEVVQTGVLVCSAKYHKDIFEHTYYNYEDNDGAAGNYEMPALSFELVRQKMVHWLQPEFNYCVADITAAYYPFIFNKTDWLSRLVNIMQRLPALNRFYNKNTILALQNIYDLGYFIHFAGCSKLMNPLHQSLLQRR